MLKVWVRERESELEHKYIQDTEIKSVKVGIWVDGIQEYGRRHSGTWVDGTQGHG